VVLSNDLGRLLGSGAGEIQIFDLHGRCTFALPGEYSSAPNVALSPDGQFAAVAAYHEVRVWDVENRHSEADLKGHKGLISYVAFSPDGGRVMTASEDGTARIWNAHTGHLLHTLAGQGKVVVAAISADGKRAAVASQDGQIRIYAVDFDDLLGLAKSNMPKEVFATVRNECCPDRR
jgi:WD40 repeat protein